MLEISWTDARRALLVAWAVLAITALYKTIEVGFAPTWLVAVVWSVAVGWVTAVSLRLVGRVRRCDRDTPTLLVPMVRIDPLGLVIQAVSFLAMMAMTSYLDNSAVLVVLSGWAVGQVIELPFPPTVADICNDNPNKLVVLGLVAGWAAIQFTGTVDVPITVFYGFAIGAVPTSLSLALDIADYKGDYRLVTGCSAIVLVLSVVVLAVLSAFGVVAWAWSLSLLAGVAVSLFVGYGTLLWQGIVERKQTVDT